MVCRITKIVWFFLLILVWETPYAQLLEKHGFQVEGRPSSGPLSNTINDVLVYGNKVWVGADGLSMTDNNGTTWTTYSHADGLGKGSVSAIAYRNGVLWVATAFDTTTELGHFDAGGGLSFSTDDGATWTWISQPVDSPDETEYKPTTTNIQNLTYDIALTDSTVWIASFGGGLRKSSNMGASWDVVTVDGYPFDALGYLTHRAFSILFDGRALWAGTAGGVHRSIDGGKTWTTFNHQNQPQGISGNFVVAIGHQKAGDRDIIWAATVDALEESEYRAVSRTEDEGLSWEICLEMEFAHNFAFDSLNSAVYVATDNGLFKSLDFGENWASFPRIWDYESGEGIYSTEVYSVVVSPGYSLWVGSADGLAMSQDDGMTWKLFRAFKIPGMEGTPDTYAYPNPFSPSRHNRIGGDGHVRFQYKTEVATRVTVRVYDYSMRLVCTVVENLSRPMPGDYAELWNGRNDFGSSVANGVYFYKIELECEKQIWGKVMVVN